MMLLVITECSFFLFLYQSTELMNSFMKMAKSNTDKNLETCGILAGSLVSVSFCYLLLHDWELYLHALFWRKTCIITVIILPGLLLVIHYCWLLQKNRKFYLTALIIPKQESTSDSVSWSINFASSKFILWVRTECVLSSSVKPQTRKKYLMFRTRDLFFL